MRSTPPAAGLKRCPQCGREAQADERFCGGCNHEFPDIRRLILVAAVVGLVGMVILWTLVLTLKH